MTESTYYTVTRVPNRKSRALVRCRGSSSEVVAYFTSYAAADRFIAECCTTPTVDVRRACRTCGTLTACTNPVGDCPTCQFGVQPVANQPT